MDGITWITGMGRFQVFGIFPVPVPVPVDETRSEKREAPPQFAAPQCNCPSSHH